MTQNIDKDAAMRELAGKISEVLTGQDLSTAVGAALVWMTAQLDVINDPEANRWAAHKLRQIADVLASED